MIRQYILRHPIQSIGFVTILCALALLLTDYYQLYSFKRLASESQRAEVVPVSINLAGNRLNDGRNITFYNSDLGNIPDNSITFISQDTEGRIWAGSSIGLLKYTSHGFISAPILGSNTTLHFNTDVIGYNTSVPGFIYLYFVTIGLCQYDIQNRTMDLLVPAQYHLNGADKVSIGLKGDLIYFSHSTPGDLFIYNLKTKNIFETRERVCGNFVRGVKGGNIGFYSPDVNSDCLVYVELKGDTIEYRSDHSVPSGYYNVVEMAGDTVMIFNRNGMTSLLHDRRTDTMKVVNCVTGPEGRRIFSGTITSVRFDSLSRELYFSTWGGIAVQSIDTWEIDVITSKSARQDQLPIEYAPVVDILKDKSGDLWLGYYENGISRVENLNVNFGNYLGNDKNLDRALKEVLGIRRGVNGELFYLTKGGLVIQEPGYGSYQVLRDEVTVNGTCNKDWFRDIMPLSTPNTYLVVTYGNYPLILEMNDLKWVFRSLKPEDAPFPCLAFAAKVDTFLGYRIVSNWGQGDVLVATDAAGENLYRYVRNLDGELLTSTNLCSDIHVQGEAIYIGTTNKGIIKLSLRGPNGPYVRKDTLFMDLIEQPMDTLSQAGNILYHSLIYSIIEGRSDTVIAFSNRGIFKIATDNSVSYHDLPDLGSTVIRCGMQSTDGHFWLGSPVGLFEYDSSMVNLLHVYNRNSGLISQNIQCIFQNYDGRLMLGTRSGVSYLKNDSFKLSQPSILVDEVFFDGVNVLPDQNIYISSPGNKNVRFEFISTDYENLPRHEVRYILSDVDDHWSEITPSRDLLMLLKPGRYELKIQENDNLGEWSSPMTSVFLYIPCQWYMSLWFWTLIVGGLLTALLWVWLDHLEAARDKQKLSETIQYLRLETIQAQMNPHFVFNMLGTIQYFILKNDRLSANRYLVKLSNLIRNFLDSSIKSSVGENGYIRSEISLRKEIELVTDYMEFERIQMNESFEFYLEIDDEINIDNVTLPPMLLQPFLENSVKHGIAYLDHGGIIRLKIWQEENGMHVKIVDNGIGRLESRKRQKDSLRSYKSHGTDLVKKRIELLNRIGYEIRLTVTDLEEGYEVYLIIH
ncbi:MAG: histidine kinase [Lewinellaceae bacterium]|nr:histidine kinase [Lewinellaceae bacterium]